MACRFKQRYPQIRTENNENKKKQKQNTVLHLLRDNLQVVSHMCNMHSYSTLVAL